MNIVIIVNLILTAAALALLIYFLVKYNGESSYYSVTNVSPPATGG